MKIRLAQMTELPDLQEIERAAGEAFANFGMQEIAEDEPLSVSELARYCQEDKLWVTVSQDDRAVAYIMVQVFDHCAHVEQVSVHPDHAGKGVGADLIEHVAQWAINNRLKTITLTTFAEVPWNAPYYQRLGFSEIPEAELSPGLRRIRRQEQARGLDRWPRVAMYRSVAA